MACSAPISSSCQKAPSSQDMSFEQIIRNISSLLRRDVTTMREIQFNIQQASENHWDKSAQKQVDSQRSLYSTIAKSSLVAASLFTGISQPIAATIDTGIQNYQQANIMQYRHETEKNQNAHQKYSSYIQSFEKEGFDTIKSIEALRKSTLETIQRCMR